MVEKINHENYSYLCKRKNFLKSTHSQMKIQEMSFMIIGLAIFFILVLLFYLAISLSGLKQTADISTQQQAVLLVAKLAGSPEFKCASGGTLCVDADKLLAVKQDAVYATFWDVNGLTVEKVFPVINQTVECNFGNMDRCSVITIVQPHGSNLVKDTSFVSLCRKDYKEGYLIDRCELAKIAVYTETKT